jgi:hypothetical protein
MDQRNDELLRLSECIESIKCEVKQKMMIGDERNGSTKVTAIRFQRFQGFKVSDFEFEVSSFEFQDEKSYRRAGVQHYQKTDSRDAALQKILFALRMNWKLKP